MTWISGTLSLEKIATSTPGFRLCKGMGCDTKLRALGIKIGDLPARRCREAGRLRFIIATSGSQSRAHLNLV